MAAAEASEAEKDWAALAAAVGWVAVEPGVQAVRVAALAAVAGSLAVGKAALEVGSDSEVAWGWVAEVKEAEVVAKDSECPSSPKSAAQTIRRSRAAHLAAR